MENWKKNCSAYISTVFHETFGCLFSGTNRVDITEEMVKSSLKHDGSAQPNSKNNKIVDSDTICEGQ